MCFKISYDKKCENCDNFRPLNQSFPNISSLLKNTSQICLILHQFNLYVLPICGKEIGDD